MGRARVLAAAAPLWIAGCPSLPLMQSAETIPEGDVQHAIGVEYFDTDTDMGPDTDDFPLALIPTYTVRFGVADRVDVGLRTSVFLNIAFDCKLQVIDTAAFDLAFAPSLQYAWLWGWLQLPMIVGFNLGESAQLIVNGRVAYFALLTDDGTGGALDEAFDDAEFFVGAGAGIYVKATSRFGVMPEVQYMRGTRAGEPAMWSFNISFTLGAQPGPRPPSPPPPPIPAAPPAPLAPPSSPPPPAGYAPHAPAPGGALPAEATPVVPPGYGPPAPTPAPPPALPPAPPPTPTP